MTKPAARLNDIASNHEAWHPSPIIQGSSNVTINGKPAARLGDAVEKHTRPGSSPHGRSIAAGAPNVTINGRPAARVGDAISCGGVVETGSPNVTIGDAFDLHPPCEIDLPDIKFPNQHGYIPEITKRDGTRVLAIKTDKPVFYHPPVKPPFVEPPPEPSYYEIEAYYQNSWKTPWPLEHVKIFLDEAQIDEIKMETQEKGIK